jgi:hypothetical protein
MTKDMTQQWLTTDIFGFYYTVKLFNELLSNIHVIIPSHYTTFRSLHSLHMSHEPCHPLLTWKLLNSFFMDGFACISCQFLSQLLFHASKMSCMVY